MPPSKDSATPLDAAILCHIRTPYLSGSGLVGTVQTRLSATLADVRRLLESLASLARQGNDRNVGNAIGSSEAPVNVSKEEMRKIMSHALHPFDLSADFSFVRGGCGAMVPREREKSTRLVDLFPLLPQLFSVNKKNYHIGWAMEPPAPLVRILARLEDMEVCRNAVAVLFVSMQTPDEMLKDRLTLYQSAANVGFSSKSAQLNSFKKSLNLWNCNVRDCFGRTVLHESVYHGNKEVVAHLLSLPFIHTNEQDAQGLTPLHIAVRKGDERIVSQLLMRGVDVLLQDASGDTALHTALRLRDSRLVELLCQCLREAGIGAEKLSQYRNKRGLSPSDVFKLRWPTFFQLCAVGDVQAIHTLYNHYLFKCDLAHAPDNLLHQSVVHVAAAAGHADVVRYLLDEVGFGRARAECFINSRLQTPLHVAAERGEFATVKFLYERYPKWLAARDITGATPLVAVLRNRRRWGTAIAEYFITVASSETIAPNTCDNGGNGALHLLCELGLFHLARLLVESHGADVNLAHTGTVNTHHFLRVTRRSKSLMEQMKWKLKHQKTGKQAKMTPILCAIRGGRCGIDIIEMLLSHGAATREDEIVELLFYLVSNEHYEVAERVLARENVKPPGHNELLCRFCREKHVVGISWCSKQGFRQLNVMQESHHPLAVSSALGDAAAVAILLEHGANANIGKSVLHTPLALAINGGHDDVVRCLVRAGACLLSADGSWSALRAAVKRGEEFIMAGLLAEPSLPPSEVVHAMVFALQDARGRGVEIRERLCVRLARALNLAECGGVHPTELLHLAASRSCFAVVRVLVDKLLALPREELENILKDAPAAPSLAYALIEPKAVPLPKGVPSRLYALHPSPAPFKRLITLRTWQEGLHHRLHLRDAFSYCASAREESLLETLLFDVGLKPWEGPDFRGWNAADYAVASGLYNSVRILLVSGLAPLRHHHVRSGTWLGILCRSMVTPAARPSETNLLYFTLKRLVCAGETLLIRHILWDVCRRCDVSDMRDASVWLTDVLLCCARSRSLEILHILTREFRVTWGRKFFPTAEPLLMAVLNSDAEMALFLMTHGAVPTAFGPIPKMHDNVKASFLREERRAVSPLWLAARLGETAILQQLLQSTDLLCHEATLDNSTQCGDILQALIDGATRRVTKERDAGMARTIFMLKRAGYLALTPDVVRCAARKGLVQVVNALVDCYGPDPFVEDLKCGGLCAIHFMVANPELCGTLRSLLVAGRSTATETVGGSVSLASAMLATPFRVNPVDYALRHGCAEGALLLLCLGLYGSGTVFAKRARTLSVVIRLAVQRRCTTGWSGYTALHAAIEMQCHSLAKTMACEMAAIHGPNSGPYAEMTIKNDDAPSLHAFMAFHLREAHFGTLLSSGVPPVVDISSPCDIPYIVWSPHASEGRFREAVRESATREGLEQPLDLMKESLRVEVRQHMLSYNENIFFRSRSFAVTALTPMACAVAAGKLSWVQLFSSCGVSLTNDSSIIAAKYSAVSTQGRIKAPPVYKLVDMRDSRKRKAPKSVRRKHVCSKDTGAWLLTAYVHNRCHISPIMLSMAIVVECVRSGAVEQRLLQQLQIIRYLLGSDECPLREEVNLLAIVAAELQLWGLLEDTVVTLERCRAVFDPISEGDIPPFMHNVVGSAHHVMHKVARVAPREIILLVARNSSFVHVEELCDAKGRTALYHALYHPTPAAVDTLLSLNVSVSKRCCSGTGRTPLMVASKLGKLGHAERLMRKEVLDLEDNYGNTALLLAAEGGHKQVVEYLLAQGSSPSTKNAKGMTAVMVAALAGHDSLAVPMVERFSGISDLFTPHTTILHCAAVGGAWGVATTVVSCLAQADPLAVDHFGYTALFLAHAFGNARVLRTLLGAVLHKGITVPSSFVRERQIISRSSELVPRGWLKGTLYLAEAVLGNGRKGSSSSLSSSHYGPMRSSETLYGHRTSIRRNDVPLLLWCVRNNNTLGVRVLGEINVGDNCYALHEAARSGNVEMVKLLLKLEVSSPDVLNESGMLPFEVAAVHKHVECASLILLHTKLDPVRLRVHIDHGDDPDTTANSTDSNTHNPMQLLASSENAEVFADVVDSVQRMSGDTWPSVAQQLFDTLSTPGPDGMTALELQLALGRAAGALRLVKILQRLSLDVAGNCAFAVSSSILHHLTNVSPAVRVLLHDMFGLTDVAKGYGMRRRRFGRLSFADVRLIGISALQSDAYCAAATSSIFTFGNEVGATSSLLERLPFEVRFVPRPFERRSAAERAKLIRWLGSSLILSSYKQLRTCAQFDAVEVEIVSHPAEEFAELVGDHLHHSIYVDGDCQLVVPDLNIILGFATRREKQRLLDEVEHLCGVLTDTMQSLPHPALSKGEVKVDWRNCNIDDVEQEAIECLIENGLKKLRVFLEGNLRDCLCGVNMTDILSVKCTAEPVTEKVHITFQYTREALKKFKPSATELGSTVDGLLCVVRFSDAGMGGLDFVMRSVLYPATLSDVNLVGVSRIRDAWVADVSRRVGQRMGGETIAFKLQLEGSELHELPLHLLKRMMADVTDAIAMLMSRPSAKKHRFLVSHIVGESLASSLRAVFVLFSTSRQPTARRAQGNLLICFNATMTPTMSDIYQCLRRSALKDEAERLKGMLMSIVSTMGLQLSVALPAVPLLMDVLGSLRHQDTENVVSFLSVLCHNDGSLVLKPLIEGVSIGWKTELGRVVRRHVRQISVALEVNGGASCELKENGTFVYKCPLNCAHAGSYAAHSKGLLSAQQIASLLLIQIDAMDPTMRSLISTTKAMACWSRACGTCTRLLDAGSQRCSIVIKRRNILDQPVGQSASDAFSFRGGWSGVKVKGSTGVVRFTAPTKAGYYLQHILLNDQPLFNSPLRIRVRPLGPHLPNTKILSTFNAVVVKRPFHIQLLLHDRYLNRVAHICPLRIEAVDGGAVHVAGWKRLHVDTVEVEVVVKEICEQCSLRFRLLAPGGAGNFVVDYTVASVTPDTYRQQFGPVKSRLMAKGLQGKTGRPQRPPPPPVGIMSKRQKNESRTPRYIFPPLRAVAKGEKNTKRKSKPPST
ncbi:ankyrin-repeat protein, putative [Trypanosoma brucei brucei TREU927]|uniref:Ankyrin-repeat protein, putative n=1 Tax=Trypanosoma brucei brucei (strain 927/4 GUTat10.1) TaxID=185431 RepID=Q38CX0_TRYB2|nr:uncharacterized protein Tb09.244.2600 [Trypanosoma brucei brucei TREU927]EAN77350.1 ankyrin-repeat protein, putative [Trypanosoma brucei brucei TREU927]